jgi:phage shock protein E
MLLPIWNRILPVILVSLMSLADYDTRASMFGIAPPSIVLPLMQDVRTVVLDVRTNDEIVSNGKLENVPHWVHFSMSSLDSPGLESNPGQIVGTDKDVPVVIYCGSGKRANKAREILMSYGYTNVVNAGAYGDITYLIK